jgi:two-component system, NtrC family, nitrogen regulation sensor histidine kinase NtrY
MMISRNLYLNIILRVILILIFSMLLSYFVIVNVSLRLSIICILILLAITLNLIKYLNTTNRKIRFFFDSVRNNDSTLTFPSDAREKSFRELYQSMQRVNEQILKLRIENRNQEQYFQILLEHLAAGIITFDQKGFVIHANTSAKRMLSVEVLTHLQQIERIDQKLFNAITGIRPDERRLVGLRTIGGEIQLSLKATSIKVNADELTILSIQDIKNELDEKELESWMKLIRVLMHEIMNSITPITSLSESLYQIYSRGGSAVPETDITDKTIATTIQGLEVIKEQGKGLMSFVESYRKLTRVPEPVKKVFKVTELFNRVRILYESLEKSSNREFIISIKDENLELFADQNLISQVLLNLVKNALEANENNPQGKIVISAALSSSNFPEICVSDNGPGITEEMLDKIFIPFFTTRQNGSGIGLSVSKQIMKIHGGSLKVSSIPGVETTFCLNFG